MLTPQPAEAPPLTPLINLRPLPQAQLKCHLLHRASPGPQGRNGFCATVLARHNSHSLMCTYPTHSRAHTHTPTPTLGLRGTGDPALTVPTALTFALDPLLSHALLSPVPGKVHAILGREHTWESTAEGSNLSFATE